LDPTIDDQYFHDAADEETLQQLTREQLLKLQNNTILAKRLRKDLCKQSDKRLRIALAETLWQSAILDLLKQEELNSERLKWFKEKIKMHSQLTAMRIMSFIDTYPNTVDSEEFRKTSHKEYRKWIGV
jgi:hypothetical protein